MAKRKKPKNLRAPARKERHTDPATDGLGSLADAIGDALRERGHTPENRPAPTRRSSRRGRLEAQLATLRQSEPDRRAAERRGDGSSDATSSSDPPSSAPRKLTPEEAMALAFDTMEESALHAHKFSGEGTDLDASIVVVDRPEPASHQDEDTPDAAQPAPSADDLLFMEAIGDEVTPLEQKRAELEARGFVGTKWHTENQLRTRSPVDLHEPDLSAAQHQLLRRSRRGGARLPCLNIRHDRRREALGRVEAFIHVERQAGARYVRIITGKGRQSRDEPVLKRAVLEWFENEGRTLVVDIAPETDQSGRYGSLVLELRSPERK